MLKGDILAVARMPERRQAGDDRRLRAQPEAESTAVQRP